MRPDPENPRNWLIAGDKPLVINLCQQCSEPFLAPVGIVVCRVCTEQIAMGVKLKTTDLDTNLDNVSNPGKELPLKPIPTETGEKGIGRELLEHPHTIPADDPRPQVHICSSCGYPRTITNRPLTLPDVSAVKKSYLVIWQRGANKQSRISVPIDIEVNQAHSALEKFQAITSAVEKTDPYFADQGVIISVFAL